MRVLKLVGIVVGAVVVLFVGIGLFLPRGWKAERSIVIQAPPEKIHPWVDSPAKWKEWFDFSGMGEFAVSVTGPERGVGATYTWASPASNGRLVIAESDPATGVRIDEAIESETTNAHAAILYSRVEGGGTRVTWSDAGDPDALPPVIGGWFSGMIGGSLDVAFEKGLANLKAKVEAEK